LIMYFEWRVGGHSFLRGGVFYRRGFVFSK
jgi:hypothetical protein